MPRHTHTYVYCVYKPLTDTSLERWETYDIVWALLDAVAVVAVTGGGCGVRSFLPSCGCNAVTSELARGLSEDS